METTSDRLQQLVVEIPDERLDEAHDAQAVLNVPADDEPLTDEELAAIARSRENVQLGRTIPDEIVRRERRL